MPKTVLIVDDSASMRQLVTFALKDAGYEVMAATDGRDALNKLNGTKIELVITDLNMPEMDGIEFIKQMRTAGSYKFTPIVMLTTESQESKKQEGKNAGASGWIVKPFTPEQLIDVVKKFAR
jgi:two-component system chemotaxis response regulator CheY